MMHSCTTEAFRSMKTNAKLLFALKDDLEVCDAEKNYTKNHGNGSGP